MNPINPPIIDQTKLEYANQKAWREAYKLYSEQLSKSNKVVNLQNVFTPHKLCYDMVGKLMESMVDFKNKTFCVFNLEFAEVLRYDFGVPLEWMLFVTDCKEKAEFAKKERYAGIQIELMSYEEFLAGEWNMKFDCIIANYPFQTKSDEQNKKTQPIWHKFVEKSFELCKENGYVCAIHPSGWRDVDGMFKNAQNIIKSKDIKYLEIHNSDDGEKTFRETTRYDWYVIKNVRPNKKSKTTIVDQNGKSNYLELSRLEFIPNCMYDEIKRFIARENEEKINLMYSSCSYHTQKNWMKKENDKDFPYPCIASVSVKSEPSCIWYSNTNKNGHFGVPKVIFVGLGEGVMIDLHGQYGMEQHCAAIVDLSENLPNIHKALKSEKFINLMMACNVGGQKGNIYSRKIIGLLRKDFWKEFVDENGNEKQELNEK